MTTHYQLVPLKAVEAVDAAGIPHAQRLIRDCAAAGILKSYAERIETLSVLGEATVVRGGVIPTILWRRIVREGADDDIWTGGTVRLDTDGMLGGAPSVEITGIGFKSADVQRLIAKHRGDVLHSQTLAKGTSSTLPRENTVEMTTLAAPKRQRLAPDLTALHSGALLLTVGQAKAALAIGHTKFYELLKAGQLERAPGEGRTRVKAASVRRIAGITDVADGTAHQLRRK